MTLANSECKLQKKQSKFVPGRVVERPYHVVRLEHAECEGDEAVENCDEDDGSRDSDGHVLGRVLHLLRSCGNSVIPNIAEVHDRCSVEDSSHPEWCEAGGVDRGLHCSRGNSCCNIRQILEIAFDEAGDDDEENKDQVQDGHHQVESGAILGAAHKGIQRPEPKTTLS